MIKKKRKKHTIELPDDCLFAIFEFISILVLVKNCTYATSKQFSRILKRLEEYLKFKKLVKKDNIERFYHVLAMKQTQQIPNKANCHICIVESNYGNSMIRCISCRSKKCRCHFGKCKGCNKYICKNRVSKDLKECIFCHRKSSLFKNMFCSK